VEADRISPFNDAPVDKAGRYVLYWMQQSQRAHFNPALEHAISRANELHRPLPRGREVAPSRQTVAPALNPLGRGPGGSRRPSTTRLRLSVK